MTKKEIIVLKAIKENYKAGMHVSTCDIREATLLNPEDFDAVCEELANKGYFTNFENDIGQCCYSFFTTYKSDSFDEEIRNNRIKYVIGSIIVPIVVGVLSAAISAFIRYGLLNT